MERKKLQREVERLFRLPGVECVYAYYERREQLIQAGYRDYAVDLD